MLKPLVVSQKALQTFHASIGGIVRTAFDIGIHRHLVCQKYDALPGQTVDTYRLVDTSARGTTARNLRGNDISVFPVLMHRNEVLLVGVSFEWVRSGEKYRFNGAQIILFSRRKLIGTPEPIVEGPARQLLRLEWAGRRDSGLFEASVAAHPHWQVDALPDYSSQPVFPAEPKLAELAELSEGPASVLKTWLSHLHLPSAAIGWTIGEGWKGGHEDCSAHANSPASTDELRAWIGSASRYLNHQLQNAVT